MTLTGASAVRTSCHLPVPSPRLPSNTAPVGHPVGSTDSKSCAVAVNARPGGSPIESSELTPWSSTPSTWTVTDSSPGLTRRSWLT